MIRVNLLAAEQHRAKSAGFWGLSANSVHILGGLVLAAAVGGTAWRHLDLQTQQQDADFQLQQARAEEQRLKAVAEELARFEAQTALLQQRVALIEQLRKGQRSPVTLLEQVSRQLPDRLWLLDMKQAGSDVVLEGRTTTLTALSDLIGNLENSGVFTRPVEIVSSEVDSQSGPEVVKFAVKATFPMGAIDSAGSPAARPGLPPARR